MRSAEKELIELRELLHNGTVFKLPQQASVFLLGEDNCMYSFHSGDAFVSRGFEWSKVRTLRQIYSFFLSDYKSCGVLY